MSEENDSRRRHGGGFGVYFDHIPVLISILSIVGGAVWWTSATNTALNERVLTNTAQTVQLRADFTEAINNIRAQYTDRMDREDADNAQRRVALYARLDADEKDTKSAAAFVNQVDNRLTRMEAQLDLVVKNITVAPQSGLRR